MEHWTFGGLLEEKYSQFYEEPTDPNGDTINGQTVDIRFPEYVLTIPNR